MTSDADMLRQLLAAASADAARKTGAGAGAPASDPEEATRDDAGAVDPDELVAYLRDELAAEDRARVERRLVADPDAARTLLDLADLEEAAAPLRSAAPEPSSAPRSAAAADRPSTGEPAGPGWRELRRRLRPWLLPTWLPVLAAASLLLCVGLGWRLVVVESRLQRVEDRLGTAGSPAPVVNLATLSLTVGRRGGGTPTVSPAPGEPLHLTVTPERRCRVYRAEVSAVRAGVASGGEEGAGATVSLPGLKRDERGSLNALVLLQPGGYTFRLFGCQPEELLSEQEFRVVGGDGGR